MQNFEKRKKKQTQKNPRENRGGGDRMLVQKVAMARAGFSMGFFFAHYQVMYVHVHIYYSI